MDTSKKKQRSLGDSIIRFLGFYRNPVYIEDQLKEADVRSAVYLTAIVSLVEIYMLLRYVKNWVLPGKVASVGEFFHYTSTYWWFLAASLLLLVYCSLFLKKKLRYLGKYSREIIFAYFLLAMYFGVTLSMHDFSRGRMILCFLTMLMYVTIICVWRPYTSILLIVVFGGGFIWLLNHFSFDKAGNPLNLSEGDYINFVTTLVTMFILVVAVYHQRYRDATKSWELGRITVTDDLTGISNMHNFEEVTKAYLAESLAQEKKPVYLTFNLENFQTFNDRCGYAGGDELLTRTAQIISNTFPGEPVARESGDNFAVLTTAEDYLKRVAEIRVRLRAAYPNETYLDVRAGAYRPRDTEDTARHAIDRARYAMRHVTNWQNSFVPEYDEKVSKEYRLRRYILNNVEKAVREGYIQVFYQPVVWAEDGTIAGCEALARWIDPEMGFLSPGAFIPALEEGRQIHKLDLCIYEQVCKRIRDSIDNGLPVLATSLNFSRLDFELMNAVGELEALVEKYRVPKEYLHVEITESAVTEDVEGLQRAMKRLHDGGFAIWLDDFGSGYSSMNVLKDFDFDLLKIDMEFLKNFHNNQNSRKIISSIINLANSLNMMTLSEGVETEEAVDFLREAGCGRLQGYYYGKPMRYEELLEKINDGTLKLGEKQI